MMNRADWSVAERDTAFALKREGLSYSEVAIRLNAEFWPETPVRTYNSVRAMLRSWKQVHQAQKEVATLYEHTGLVSCALPISIDLSRDRCRPIRSDFQLYLLSDFHLGASAVNDPHLRRDLDEAKELEARILINGDVFDAILPQDPKRFMPSVLTADLQGKDAILNAEVDYAVEYLKPYADLIDMIGMGNHEAAILRHHSANMSRLLIDRLNGLGGKINYGGYAGFIVYQFGQLGTFKVFYHHGGGGVARVTKGMILLNRFRVWIENADVIWLAHTHSKLGDLGVKAGVDDFAGISMREERCVITGSYMNYIEDGYMVQKAYEPQPHGGVPIFVEFYGHGKKRFRGLQ